MKRAFAIVVLLAACNRNQAPQPGARHDCTCTYLTDYDDTARVVVDACIADGKKAEDEARYCAAESAHNHIDKCECKATAVKCDARAKDACQHR